MSILILSGSVGMFVGTLLPWVTVGFFSVSGIDTPDGTLVAAAAVVAIIFASLNLKASKLWNLIVIGAMGVVGFGTNLYDLINIESLGDDPEAFFEVSAGVGLYLGVAASAAIVVGVINTINQRK